MLKTLFPLIAFLLSLTAGAQTPTSFPIPDVWLKANVTNDSLNQWTDVSGNNNHAQAQGLLDYTEGLMNFQPALVFNSSQGALTMPFFPASTSNVTVFAVYKSNAGQNGYGIWSLKLDSASNLEVASTYMRDFSNINIYSDSSLDIPAVNLLKYRWINQEVDSALSTMYVVGSDSLPFSGKFAEFMFYDTTLSYINVAKVHTYLGLKYGIGIDRMHYVNAAGEKIWNYKDNAEYKNQVAGLGADSLLGINQKQSCAMAGESILTIYTGTLEEKNADNITHLNEGDFLIWGDNGKEITSYIPDTLDPNFIPGVSERKWLMVRSGNTAMSINTNIKLYFPEISGDTILNLLINPDTNFNFPYSTTTIHPADSVDSLGYHYFYNVKWDMDSSGSDAFAFQYEVPVYVNNRNQEENPEDDQGDENQITSIDVFPNPTKGAYTIEAVLKDISVLKLSIQDESGKIIKQELYSGADHYTINGFIDGKGCYLMLIESKEQKESVKLIVQ
ncbi:MAG: T9SS type A sorting domain-containing protein [Bacteroidales bacterium]|nr:T9SS type A sorting domain-containing protein [Bacteroidales bacterium]